MTRVEFTAPEYRADGRIAPARYAFAGDERGWTVEREGAEHLRLGPGYRLLRTSHCGVCATDLARRHLPFPLPQITGHEVVAVDGGRALAVEINASCVARGIEPCEVCAAGMPTHCPQRLVLGIHDLPGGFGPWLLAPVHAVVPIPDGIGARAATLAEPFAAAWHAVETIAPQAGDRVLVLGPGRLGSLVIAALAAWRALHGVAVHVAAAGRGEASRARALRVGADAAHHPDAAPPADVVVDTTGSPAALARAVALAQREVHLKSTTGAPALGLRHVTELVVDELSLVPPGTADGGCAVEACDAAAVDAAIRPVEGREASATGPRGRIVVTGGVTGDAIVGAVHDRGLRITSSRCGDIRAALPVLARDGLGDRLAAILVSDVLPAQRLADAFAAATRGGNKILVAHPGALL